MVDDAVQLFVGDQARQLRVTLSPSVWPRCLRVATAMAVSHTFDHGSDDAAKKARASLPKILSPIGLSRRLPVGRHAALPARWYEDALGLEEQRLAEALRPDDDELVVPIQAQEVVDLGRAVQQSLVEVFGDADVVGVHGPRSHTNSEA